MGTDPADPDCLIFLKGISMLVDKGRKASYSLFYNFIRRCGEIGRHDRLKICWGRLRLGSSPSTGNS